MKRAISIRVFSSGLIFALAVVVALSIVALLYTRMRGTMIQNANLTFAQAATIVSQDVAAEHSQIVTSLALVRRSQLAGATNFASRLSGIGMLDEILSSDGWADAAYVGYGDGDFVSLRRLSPTARTSFGAPASAKFILQSVERSGSALRGMYVFYDGSLHEIARRNEPRYRYDPRTRPWFAAPLNGIEQTAPYVFFSTGRLGITYSTRARSGSVFGIDVDFGTISAHLARIRPTATSVAALVEANGTVIAGDRVPPLAKLGSTYRDAAGRTWFYHVSRIAGGGAASPVLVVGVPEDELLGPAQQARSDALVLALAMVVFCVPLAIWLSGFIAHPLRRLLHDIDALRGLDFAHRENNSSKITEIEALSDAFAQMRTHIGGYASAATRFVPREFLDQLQRADIVALELGDHVERRMAILFSDIRSFTALSESMSPQQTFNFINSYLTRVGPIVREHGGFIDKYIGDAIMGLFPGPIPDAVDAAIAIQRRVVVYNQERARAGYAPIAIGVGVHVGDLMMGTIGEVERFETTVLADAVNVASRLESLTKTFGSLILISGAAVEGIDAANYTLRLLCEVQVKGTTRPIELFEVCDADPPADLADKLRTAPQFRAARADYLAGRFAEAENRFAMILAEAPGDRAAQYFRARAAELNELVADGAWDGIERMEAK